MNLGLLGYQHLPDEFSHWLEQSKIQIRHYKTADDFLLDEQNAQLSMLLSTYHLGGKSIIDLLRKNQGLKHNINVVVTECQGVNEAVQVMQAGAKVALPGKVQSTKLISLVNQYGIERP
ncbi:MULTISPECIES: hypothetical protein [unclassified Motilimonas]|uniref:hypothetical protein n=1 Tax=Motilimonas TaxID=1914248 RepID=UPI001E3BFE5B|nr:MULTISPECIES: hypothetical protein [unclassified Motilimonas]MCE0557202.1 hypothetical protein [Motilimonas sp. E26]MDO6524445.1 hypothetical protein [Motilimonas sp. 1_MG-2023]